MEKDENMSNEQMKRDCRKKQCILCVCVCKRHIRPNYSFTEICINWIASSKRYRDTKTARKRVSEWMSMRATEMTVRYINEMRFIFDDNFVFNGPNLFILTQAYVSWALSTFRFFLLLSSTLKTPHTLKLKTKCPFFSFPRNIYTNTFNMMICSWLWLFHSLRPLYVIYFSLSLG